jgi:hypothetical protein
MEEEANSAASLASTGMICEGHIPASVEDVQSGAALDTAETPTWTRR